VVRAQLHIYNRNRNIKALTPSVAHGSPDGALPAYDEQSALSAHAYIIDPDYPVELFLENPLWFNRFSVLKIRTNQLKTRAFLA